MTDDQAMTSDEAEAGAIGAAGWNLDALASDLQAARDDWRRSRRRAVGIGEAPFPSRRVMAAIRDDLAGALFPLRLGTGGVRPDNETAYVRETLDRALTGLAEQVRLELIHQHNGTGDDAGAAARAIVGTFAQRLPGIRRLIDSDVAAAFTGDPAARSVDEILLCYPFVTAMVCHRPAHALYELGAPLVARMLAEIAHSETAIDIHPGARIGGSFFIDHGSGVVIGETAIIGERVRIYQAVTLGARSFPTDEDGALTKGIARHPIVEDDVVIYAGATILGRVTIGAGSVIGGNVWLTQDVPPRSVIHQAFAEREKVKTCIVPAGHVVSEPARDDA
ncbi:serine acetyltransferase [Sphingomonas sp. NBWT7]|nr:serine O-acetyltransferase EpsC [Sphingomonas sp. NBWT7]QNE32123.1 serine acetyltransferase [Sphingomonas sp. NBWT7]